MNRKNLFTLVEGIASFAFIGFLIFQNRSEAFRLKTNKGGTILFKEENVSCNKIPFSLTVKDLDFNLGPYESPKKPPKNVFKTMTISCRASGVRTDIAGNKFAYSSQKTCTLDNNEYIPCIAGKHYEKYDPNEKGITGGSNSLLEIFEEDRKPVFDLPEYPGGGLNDVWGRY